MREKLSLALQPRVASLRLGRLGALFFLGSWRPFPCSRSFSSALPFPNRLSYPLLPFFPSNPCLFFSSTALLTFLCSQLLRFSLPPATVCLPASPPRSFELSVLGLWWAGCRCS